jgi:hypothetical protein
MQYQVRQRFTGMLMNAEIIQTRSYISKNCLPYLVLNANKKIQPQGLSPGVRKASSFPEEWFSGNKIQTKFSQFACKNILL